MKLLEYLAERGSQAELARKISVPSVLVHQWAHDKRRVPAERCRDIETATAGAVTAAELRPDVFGTPEPSSEPTDTTAAA